MARWTVTISGKGVRKAAVEKLAAKMTEEFGESVRVETRDTSPPESRQDRYDAATELISEARGILEELRDELQEWLDGMPENLQQGSKAEEIQSAIDELENQASELENIEGNSPSFPAMR